MSLNAKIIEKFSSAINDDTVRTITELKKILSDIYKEVKVETVDSDSDNDASTKKRRRGSKKNADKPKKAPSAYNNFIKQKMQELKESDSSIPPKELMKVASGHWSKLSDDEKISYKTTVDESNN